MTTINIAMNFSDAQIDALKAHIRNTRSAIPGNAPDEIIYKQIYPTVESLLQEQFYSSIRHLLPQETEGEAARLKREAEEAAKRHREAELSMFSITDGGTSGTT